MSNCPHCNNPIGENQVICLNCGSQIKPLKTSIFPFLRNKYCVIIIIMLMVVMFSVLILPGLFG